MSVIPATWEAQAGKITVQGQPRQSYQDLISTNKPGMVVHACHLSYTGGRGRKIIVLGWPRLKVRTYLKDNLKTSRAEGVAQVAQCLPIPEFKLQFSQKKKQTNKHYIV
jgi:hypothetical protein